MADYKINEISGRLLSLFTGDKETYYEYLMNRQDDLMESALRNTKPVRKAYCISGKKTGVNDPLAGSMDCVIKAGRIGVKIRYVDDQQNQIENPLLYSDPAQAMTKTLLHDWAYTPVMASGSMIMPINYLSVVDVAFDENEILTITRISGEEFSGAGLTAGMIAQFIAEANASEPALFGDKKQFTWPAIRTTINSPFGYRYHPIDKKRKHHDGIDIAGKLGEPIYAPRGGKVTIARFSQSFGNYVQIDHGDGYKTELGHAAVLLTSEGEEVMEGQLIGLIGSTGKSTGPHIHYNVILNGKKIDPLKVYKTS